MKKTVYGVLTVLAAFVLGAGFYACDPGSLNDVLGNTKETVDIAYTATADGANGTTTSTKIDFVFDAAVPSLGAGDISIDDGTGSAAKGTLSGGGTNWSLAITVAKAGSVKVKITRTGIENGEKTVTVYKADEVTPVTYTATADGESGTTDSTKIDFVFSEAVSLVDTAISVTGDVGSVTKGALTGNGEKWSLGITVNTAGSVTVAIANGAIESGSKTVAVHKANEATPAIITYTAVADGENGTTTKIDFIFSDTVNLIDTDISVANNTGDVTKGTLSGSGTSWSLGIASVTTAGSVTVTIAKQGIESDGKTVNVHLAVLGGPSVPTPPDTYKALLYRNTSEGEVWVEDFLETDGTGNNNGKDALTLALAYIHDNGMEDEAFVIELADDQEVKPFVWPANVNQVGIKITLRGKDSERKITWNGYGQSQGTGGEIFSALFSISNQGTLTLDNNITLDGKNEDILPGYYTSDLLYNGYMVGVSANSKLVMENGSKITRYKARKYYPVYVAANANFTMNGGEISGTTGYNFNVVLIEIEDCAIAGGVAVSASNGYVTMNGGTIKNNGGGAISGGTVVMNGGTIENNGSGVASVLTMNNGIIQNNSGDGVSGTLTMNGGTIQNNEGWAVYSTGITSHIINNGIITGNGKGLYINTSTLVIKGGTISLNNKNNNRLTSEAIFVSTGSITLEGGTVDDLILVGTTSSASVVAVIYVDNNFAFTNNINVVLAAANASIKNTNGWKKGKAMLKGVGIVLLPNKCQPK